MKPIVLFLSLLIAAAASAQVPPGAPAIGPGSAPAQPRGDLWQMLTPEQRDQLWRTLTPEQRSDLWGGLQPQERREMRERLDPGDLRGASSPWAGRRQFDRGDGSAGKSMSPQERQQIREQVREAHRLRRERIEAERERRPQ